MYDQQAICHPRHRQNQARAHRGIPAGDARGCGGQPQRDCLRFDLLKDEKDPNKFYFYEVYKNSNEAIDYHKSMEWYKAWTAFKDSGGVEEQYASKAIAINYTAP